MGPEEEILHGDLRLQELMKERVRLREKTSLVETRVKKLEEEIKNDFLDEKMRVINEGAHDYVNEFGDYCRELINLMPCIEPYITKRIC